MYANGCGNWKKFWIPFIRVRDSSELPCVGAGNQNQVYPLEEEQALSTTRLYLQELDKPFL